MTDVSSKPLAGFKTTARVRGTVSVSSVRIFLSFYAEFRAIKQFFYYLCGAISGKYYEK
jgi:hypothetical protein